MATYSKVFLSSSVDGKAISVTTNDTSIHTAQAGTSGMDEVWLYAHNNGTTTLELTINWGGNTGDDQFSLDVAPAAGLVLVSPGLSINNGQEIQASSSADTIGITGYINRITA